MTCCDGGWLISGHFSETGTFLIILEVPFSTTVICACICDEELWKGTFKAAEGHLNQVLWFKCSVKWAGCESSPAKGFSQSYSYEQESNIVFCRVHVGRAHGKNLEELKTKTFFPLHSGIISAKCCCASKNHSFRATWNQPICGCIEPGFIQNAKRNDYCALVHAGNSHDE